MLKDYMNVIEYIKKLDICISKIYGKGLYELDYNGSSSSLERVIKDIKINNKERDINTFDIDISRSLNYMTYDDILNFLLCTKSSQYGTFVLIRYSEIGIWNNTWMKAAPFDAYNGLLREMRSIVIDLFTYEIISLPFYKFMNINENKDYLESEIMNRLMASKLVEYADKIDGSFIQITSLNKRYSFYPYSDLLTSSKNLKDTLIVNDARKWYEEHTNYKYFVNAYKEYTILFEWISFDDRHIVNYTKEDCGLWVIGMRHKVTGELVSYNMVVSLAEKFGLKHTEVVYGTYEEIKHSLSKYKSNEKEGYVLNIDGFLVKLKCQSYLNMVGLIKEKTSSNAVIKSIDENTFDELLLQLPDEYRLRISEMADKVYNYLDLMDLNLNLCLEYLRNKHLEINDINQWFNSIPQVLRGALKKQYFSELKGKPIEARKTYLKVAGIANSSCITLKEIENRLEKLNKININDYFI